MKILIDIGHPAHVHYFRNFIAIMKSKGHEIFVTSRNKDIIQLLLKKYNIKFVNRGKGASNLIGKILYILKADIIILWHSIKFKPDMFMSFGSIYPAHVSKLIRKPHIAFDDTEHSTEQYKLYEPFTDLVVTPYCFNQDLREKHIKFNGTMEMCYLHKNYFTPDSSVLTDVGLKKDEVFFLVRFAAFNASHDSHSTNFRKDFIPELIKLLENKGRIIISSEVKLDMSLSKYQVSIPPEKYHSLLYFSHLYIGESSTSAEEAAILGVPSINFERITKNGKEYSFAEFSGILKELENHELVHCFYQEEVLIAKVREFFAKGIRNIKTEWNLKSSKFLENKIDVTSFMVYLVENYPHSRHELIGVKDN